MKKNELLNLIGKFPEKVPLNVLVLDEQVNDKYTQQKVEYSVDGDERVRAYLLIPKNDNKKYPAVFAHHQHGTGKSEVVGLDGDANLAYAKELAERGYIVIAPDALAFEERNYLGDSSETQYAEFIARLIQGKTLNAKVVNDISAAIDYLCTLPEVDTTKIGFIGHSYGGQMALWYPAFDDRIKATVSNCRCISYALSLENEIGIQMEFAIPGISEWGDIGDVVGFFEGCASLVSATTEDKYCIGAQNLCDYIKSEYPKQDFELKMYEGGHMFSSEMRKQSYEWLDSKLA